LDGHSLGGINAEALGLHLPSLASRFDLRAQMTACFWCNRTDQELIEPRSDFEPELSTD
jgi:hypothetical protein